MKKNVTFIDVARLVVADCETDVKAGRRPATALRDAKQRLRTYYEPFFGKTLVKDVNSRKLKDFMAWLVDEWEHSTATILVHMSFVSVTLKLAADEGLIVNVPRVPRPKQKDCPRPGFTQPEYRHLLLVQRKLEKANPPIKIRSWTLDYELRAFTTFMVNSFLRPADAMSLRHKDVERKISEDGKPYLKLISSRSKTNLNPVVTMPTAVPVYERLRDMHKGRGYGKPDDFVFQPARNNRTFAMEVLRRQFVFALDQAGLRETATGEERTLYSLRHAAITFRLLLGDIDLLTLARNCRTSVEMIDRFYAKALTAEMNIDRVHSMRRPSRLLNAV